MSRAIGGPLASHLDTRSHKLAYMLRLDLLDGTAMGMTDHSADLTFAGVGGSLLYSASTGILPSDVTLRTGLEADNFEITGPIGETVALEALLGGRFNRARVRLFKVNWSSLGSGNIPIMAGSVSNVRAEGGRFVLEVRSDFDRFNQSIGRVITPYCPGDHATCCVQIAPETTTTVTGLIDTLTFNVAATLDPDNYRDGKLWFTSGALAGTFPVEIFSVAGNTVRLFVPLVAEPEVGDELTAKEGCDRTRDTCRDRFNNVINFRGFPEVPGSDQALKMAYPGSGRNEEE